MNLNNKEVKKILIDQKYLVEGDFLEAEKICLKSGRPLIDVLLSLRLISRDILGQALAEWYKVPYADLNSNQPPREQVLRISEEIAKKYRAVLFSDNGKKAIITTDNPVQEDLEKNLKAIFPKRKISIAFSAPQDIDNAFIYYRQALNTKFSAIIKNNQKLAPEIIEAIIDDAITYRSSDIHFEPQGNEVLIRFRVDGLLREAGLIKKEYYENILNRLKIQAHLRIDEHNSAQDGAIRFVYKKDRMIDLRVSVIPALDGEKVVIRLLAEYIKDLSLAELGFNQKAEALVDVSISKPFGLILSVGPTGSGKTTTLYTLLKKLNRPEVNVTTIEDPVEYKILGVNQIQVNSATGLTFAKGLRSIVRQDPNVILVGEIRDQETVEISINAALTGHLVLSTFHSNDAVSAIPRLVNMGAEPFLLASTLEIIVAQRLVRKLCENCRYSETVDKNYFTKISPNLENFISEGEYTIFKAKGCPACNNSGYKGRIGLIEVLSITPALKELILKNPSAEKIWQMAKSEGAMNLFEDGLEKIKDGLTSLEEVVRVAPPGSYT